MSQTINSATKFLIITGLVIVPFIPLYVANGMFFPFITGKAFVFRVVVQIIFALWLILVLRERNTPVHGTAQSVVPRINGLNIFITIFVGFMLIADLAGLNPLRSMWSNFERMEGWITLIHLWGYFLVLSSVITSSEHWKKFFDIVLIAGFITAVYGLFQFLGQAAIHQGSTRVDASLGNSAYMAVYMLINAFLAAFMVFLNNKRHVAYVWIYSVLAAFFSFIMFQTATRGTILGWVAAIIISAAFYAIYEKKNNNGRNIALGVLGAMIIICIGFYLVKDAAWIQKNEVLGRLASISITDTKTQARGFIWPMALEGVFSSPKNAIMGIGQENFNYYFNEYYNPKMWPHEQWFDRAHSVFIDWLVAGGIVGLLLYISLYLAAFYFVLKSDLTVGQKSILTGLLVGYGIHNIFVFDNQTSYVMFFTILAYIHSLRPGKTYAWLGGAKNNLSEDGLVVRDYVLVPIIIILFGASMYLINIRAIQSNKRLITALVACSNGQNLSADVFKNALKLGQTVANQEIREQMYTCASSVNQSQLSNELKSSFYTLAKEETENQKLSTPNDARGYIIAGQYFDYIGDALTAQPLLEKAHELSPTKQTITFELASNYMSQGKAEEALKLLEKAYADAPENPTSKVAYITSLIASGKEAKINELFPNDKEIYSDVRVINAYVYSKQYGKAIELYKKLIEKNPNDQNSYSALASVYLMNSQPAQAIHTLQLAETKFPELKNQIQSVIKQIQEGKVSF